MFYVPDVASATPGHALLQLHTLYPNNLGQTTRATAI